MRDPRPIAARSAVPWSALRAVLQRSFPVLGALLLAGLVGSCDDGEDRRGCNVDCSNIFTGKIDVRFYGYTTREECRHKGEAAGCPAKWCNSSDDCEKVY